MNDPGTECWRGWQRVGSRGGVARARLIWWEEKSNSKELISWRTVPSSPRNAPQPPASQKTGNCYSALTSQELNIFFRRSRWDSLAHKGASSSGGLWSGVSWKWGALQHAGLGEHVG